MDIKVGDEIYAIHVKAEDVKDGSEWVGDKHESLQAQRFKYPEGHTFRTHFHILNPRTIKRTQEAFIVISGVIEVTITDSDGVHIGRICAKSGDAVFVYRGGHGIRVLEDCVVWEVKAGQYTYVSEDKKYV